MGDLASQTSDFGPILGAAMGYFPSEQRNWGPNRLFRASESLLAAV